MNKKNSGSFKTFIRLVGNLKEQKLRLVIVTLCIISYVFLNVYSPYYSAFVIDNLFNRINECVVNSANFSMGHTLSRQMLAVCLMYFFTGVFYFLQGLLMASVAEKLILKFRKDISNKLNKMPLSYFDNNKPGEILSRITSDLDKVSETLQTGLLKLLCAIGTLIGSFSFMVYYSYILTFIFLGVAILSLILTNIISRKTLKYSIKRQECLATFTGLTEEYYTGRDVIKAYNQEEYSINKINQVIDELKLTTRKTDFLQNCVNPLIRFFSRLAQALIMFLACLFIIKGKMSLGIVQAFFQYMNLAAEPLTETSYMINSLQSALASVRRTFEFLDDVEEVPDRKEENLLNEEINSIKFDNVSFGYFPDKILMKNISFEVKKGQKVAIVGSTGAGKTTLVNLLMRFYELNDGNILLNDVPTTSLTRENLRKKIGMVLQDTWLFGGTISQNIAYGKKDATIEEIKEAAKKAQIDHFINTTVNGYDTILDNESSSLSVGQKQLLTIARVFLSNSPIIILDEATSSVDTRTEMLINKAMNSLMEGKTSFVIAHRLSTIRDADMILYMENGNIIEQGNHETLLKKKGAYYNLYMSQFS